ncbi:MAG: DNA cytosine methyltransferase [Gemmataceae bacterium]|nr:DNA cytosine methyltransferase [Gemmataceae bacterium]
MSRTLPYEQVLERELTLPPEKGTLIALDLFAGCGGLALGFEAAGFLTVGFERDEDCCATYRENLHSPCHQMILRPGQELTDGAQVIIGGPPCQPFSVNGHQSGNRDDRDGFPAYLSAVERYRPRLALFENVRGMLYQNRTYFDRIVQALEELGYRVEWALLNAVHHGVPQNRERLFVVAHHSVFDFPEPTHLGSPVTAGEALGELAPSIPEGARFLTPSMDDYVARYEKASKCIRPRDLHLDQPSRTVTCRNLNGATGDMLRIRLQDGRRRRLTVREGARLQGFPDWFTFCGNEGSQFNQVGNAVPPLLAKAMACSVRECLDRRSRGARPGRSRERTFFD